ncbi:LEAF RUST 10 DISEASE-RESISTANCE LOCUS RECEPTOR-LIKE PROTEIN KINASE-like 1.5 [Macadamia integrifolia]|uniref:LEAF RUST 10 DISEASE-RESISTANCE LOCUS RECEPTOR-LIKE PROTEIN KINASE-like 1.5 n=1 Tax=Macadamia integrifolia TaxID=60698 RepID=UPI001C4F1E2E|nr:LEAF RUST 10 DISEASE-RESISTANCE LOCUS RECEPTOR-LIKE PROTEIN KINASE-like 1.5 [Macadamia integrifolia]
MTHITEAAKKSMMLRELEKDKFSAQAIENCKELMDYAIDDLKKSFDELDHCREEAPQTTSDENGGIHKGILQRDLDTVIDRPLEPGDAPRCLERKNSLAWEVRVEVAMQTAMALEHLHFSVASVIVHGDVTSSNMFVEKDMRLLVFTDSSSSKSVWTGPQGTPGYLDPEYHQSFMLTEKSDMYSFGVVLLADMVLLKIQVGGGGWLLITWAF